MLKPHNFATAPKMSFPVSDVESDANDRIRYSQSLRGAQQFDDKTRRELAAVGGLRDARASASKLPSLTSFGSRLGNKIMSMLKDQHSASASSQS